MSKIEHVQIEESWKIALKEEFEAPYFQAIKDFLLAEKAAGKTIYPEGKFIFNAFNSVSLNQVKVVILGQDPYHGAGQAHGLSFSVQKGVKVPPSLKNIYKELESDIAGFVAPKHGYLQEWANQGVILLNAILTVEAAKANAHKNIGWHKFTDAAIRAISQHNEHVVFMLWGKPAQEKAALIDAEKHLILMAAHPSPLAGGKFFGSKHFSQANAYLQAHGKAPIDWTLSE